MKWTETVSERKEKGATVCNAHLLFFFKKKFHSFWYFIFMLLFSIFFRWTCFFGLFNTINGFNSDRAFWLCKNLLVYFLPLCNCCVHMCKCMCMCVKLVLHSFWKSIYSSQYVINAIDECFLFEADKMSMCWPWCLNDHMLSCFCQTLNLAQWKLSDTMFFKITTRKNISLTC